MMNAADLCNLKEVKAEPTNENQKSDDGRPIFEWHPHEVKEESNNCDVTDDENDSDKHIENFQQSLLADISDVESNTNNTKETTSPYSIHAPELCFSVNEFPTQFRQENKRKKTLFHDDSYIGGLTEKPLSALNKDSKKDVHFHKKKKVTIENLFEISVEILQNVKKLKEQQDIISKNVKKLEAAFVKAQGHRDNEPDIPDDTDQENFESQQFNCDQEFEEFCDKLGAEKTYRDVYVNYLVSTYGGVNIGDVVRSCIRTKLSDELLLKYNRTGRDGKRQLPSIFAKCIYYCVQHFQASFDIEVKRGKDITKTTVEGECMRQIEIYLSNTRTRLKRKIDKAQKYSQSAIY